MMPDSLTDLYRTHDGPPPRPALKAALLEGKSSHTVRRIRAGWTLACRRAADQRQGIARRRAACITSPQTDPWLKRLVADLALHRAAAEFWRGHFQIPIPCSVLPGLDPGTSRQKRP
jgi:hypothetical protein